MYLLPSFLFVWVGSSQASLVQRQQHARPGRGFVKSLSYKQRLRVCNAYPYDDPLDVYVGNKKLTEKGAMPYKTCKQFETALEPGSRIEFMAGAASAGSFSISDLPNNDCVLLLVIYRHDTLLTAAAFKSHVFANLMNAQVAVIDTYKGTARGTPRILQFNDDMKEHEEVLKYNSLVAVNPGVYTIELLDPSGKRKTSAALVTKDKESYVVLRVGVEAQKGKSFPESLVVYPETHLRSSANVRLPCHLIGMLAVLIFASKEL